MSNVRRARRLAGAALVVAATSGCTQAGGLTCDPTLVATGDAFEGAMTELVTVSGTMRASLAVACAAIATDLGMSPPIVGNGTMVSDATMQQVCTMATAAIKAAWVSPPLIEGGQCQVDATAQFNCESTCDVTGQCTAPSIVARCSPADLSGTCTGDCEAMATCEGSATVAAQCQGTCAASCTGTCGGGNCTGTCSGTSITGMPCAGTCDGECTGTCTGTCSGDCTLASGASINCGANATCKGGCSVAYTAPVCEGALTPPTCNLNANCEAACASQASLQATCTPPSVVFLSSGTPTALDTTLGKNLPAILNVIAQGKLVATAAANVSSAAQSVSTEITNSAACTVMFGVELATQVQTSVAASTTITVSIQASASVSAAAVGG
jgi:hypothetical protein